MTDAGTLDALRAAAREVAARAHAPYSRFQVGAAVLWSDGAVSLGVNVENASLPLGVCAERHAVAAGVAAGHDQAGPIRAVAVWADSPKALRPCGGCRQVLHEFSDARPEEIVVHCSHGEAWEERTLAELLPEPFGPRDWA